MNVDINKINIRSLNTDIVSPNVGTFLLVLVFITILLTIITQMVNLYKIVMRKVKVKGNPLCEEQSACLL